jgi:hypothetical protein
MKAIFKTSLIICTLFFQTQVKSQKAVQYMDKISKEFTKISEETWDYTRAVAHNKKAKQIESRRRDMLNANRAGLIKVKNMQPFNGDASYRDSTIRYLELSYAVLNNDYSKIVDMEEISEQSYDAMEAYMTAQEIANDKLEAAFEVASQGQKDFAKNNNINLVDNETETAQKLEKASEVFKFYNKIYLLFFKPYKQEMYLLDAQAKGDINAMKQNQEALKNLSKEAIEKLKTVKPYRNNTTLKAAVGDVFDFYIYESTKISALIDFYLAKEKFDKLKTALDKKGQSSATPAEINEFNAALKEYNKSIAGFNNINNDLNTKRATYLDRWNNAVSRYLDRNVSNKK